MRSRLRTVIIFMLTVGLLAFFLRKADPAEVWAETRRADPALLLYAVIVTAVTTMHTSAATEPPRAATMTAHSRSAAPTSYDRVLGLADALETCSHETFFARIACEHRARTRFCEAAGAPQIPQCAEPPPREYGQ